MRQQKDGDIAYRLHHVRNLKLLSLGTRQDLKGRRGQLELEIWEYMMEVGYFWDFWLNTSL